MDPVPFDRAIVPEFKNEFFAIYREVANFLKHADKDPEATLPLYDIVQLNDLLIWFCIVRYQTLFRELTAHMTSFFAFLVTFRPSLLKWSEVPGGKEALKLRSSVRSLTRGDVLKLMAMKMNSDGDCRAELLEDLQDVYEASRQTLPAIEPSSSFP
jgi:hypothetical protein